MFVYLAFIIDRKAEVKPQGGFLGQLVPRGSTADLNDAVEFVAAISRRPDGIEPP
jgi:hypothetical protein